MVIAMEKQSRLKLMTVLGTRPEIIRLSEIIKACDKYFEQIFVHTGQNYDYELNQIFFDDLELRQPDYFLNVAGVHLGETIGHIIEKSYTLMKKITPDALLVLGDTNSALCAIPAKRLKIPIFHMEAGNRCFDENLPEETNRRIVDHIADVNLCYSEHARRYLNAEGINKERTFVVGSPMAEVLDQSFQRIMSSNVLDKLSLKKKEYILLSSHREENIDDNENFTSLMTAINHIAENYQFPIIYSMHPRSKKRIQDMGFVFHPLVKAMRPFCFSDYNTLQYNAYCVVSDSGTLPEESAYFLQKGMPFPAVSIRTSTERPEAIDKAAFLLAGITAKQVLQAVQTAVLMQEDGCLGIPVHDYLDRNVSTKVVKIIQGYTGVINKMVWRK